MWQRDIEVQMIRQWNFFIHTKGYTNMRLKFANQMNFWSFFRAEGKQ